MKRHPHPFRHLKTHSIIKAWSAAKTNHRTAPDQQPAPRVMPWRVKASDWADQPRAHRDQHKRRHHLRRQQE